MLSQAVLAAYSKPRQDGIHFGQLTVTGVSPCAFGTYLNYHKLDPRSDSEETDPIAQLRMKNGHWQENEVLEDLQTAGFKMRCTGANQMTLHVSKVPITGRPDGFITVNRREDVLSIKAMSLERYTDFRDRGFIAEPFIRCQEQLYLASDELKDKYEGTWVYAKHKDTCRPYDLFEPYNPTYSKPIIEALESIILSHEEVHRPDSRISLCPHCRHKQYCWGENEPLAIGPKIMDLPKAAELWRKGKLQKDTGEEMIEEARSQFEQALGEDSLMFVEDIRVKRVSPSPGFSFSQDKFVEKYGAAALTEVMIEKQRESYIRVTQSEDK